MSERTSYPITVLLAGLLMLFPAAGASAQAETHDLPAFPGAEGFGAFAVGGRGGTVHLVTTLADYGPDEDPIEGSLRAAIEAEGFRTIVFRVAGYIELKRPLEIRHPNITIAGQTAPGEGIGLKNYGVEIYASEVILRYLRVRLGDVAHTEQDAINVRGSNVIIDHCSVSWGTDETLSVIGEATNVTVQWCLITESLNNSVHHKGAHGYGTLLTTSGNVTIHHSAYAFHHSRNPRPKDLLLDFRNNLIYGFGDRAGYNLEDFTRMNYVGNYVVPLAYSRDPTCGFNLGSTNARFFVEGNRLRSGAELLQDWQLICTPDELPHEKAEARVRMMVPFATPSVTTDPPEVAFRRILKDAGATRPARDAVDRRVIDLIRAGEGRIIDSQTEVGGWPPLHEAPPPPDADRDGLPDRWEAEHGLDSEDGADQAGDLDADGYTNLEEYLNGTDPAVPFAWVSPPAIRPEHGTAFTDSSLTVTVVPSAPDVPVYVTLDGREPTTTSPRYRAPLRLTESTHVRAKIIQEGTAAVAAFAAYERLAWHEAAETLPSDLEPGLRYAYYEAEDWDEGPSLDERKPLDAGTAPGVDFGLPHRATGYALVFEGYLDVPHDGIYAFYLHDDARSRLYIDGELVTYGVPSRGQPGRMALRAGKHRFHLRSVHEEAGGEGQLRWQGPGIAHQPIPDAVFFWNPMDL